MPEYFDKAADQSYDDYAPEDRFSEFGGESDLWGLNEITVGQIQDPAFKIKFDADLGAARVRADQVKVEVFYTVPGTDVQNAQIYPEHQVNTSITNGDIVWAIADDGIAHQYVATGSGTTGSVAPVFPSWTGQTVVDGDITWTEAGQYQPASLPPYYKATLLSGAIGRDENGNRIFIIVGQKGLIKTSQNGKDWTERNSGISETLRGVAAGLDGFIAVGDNGVILSSTNGVAWGREQSNTKDSLYSIDFDRKRGNFSAVGKDGLIRQKQGANWNSIQR